jgi:hypothetical protein
MLFLLGHIVESQAMHRLQTGLILFSKVPKARLEQKPQENMQETCCFKPAERIYTLYREALEGLLSRAGTLFGLFGKTSKQILIHFIGARSLKIQFSES